jgi:hypothetical protein
MDLCSEIQNKINLILTEQHTQIIWSQRFSALSVCSVRVTAPFALNLVSTWFPSLHVCYCPRVLIAVSAPVTFSRFHATGSNHHTDVLLCFIFGQRTPQMTSLNSEAWRLLQCFKPSYWVLEVTGLNPGLNRQVSIVRVSKYMLGDYIKVGYGHCLSQTSQFTLTYGLFTDVSSWDCMESNDMMISE